MFNLNPKVVRASKHDEETSLMGQSQSASLIKETHWNFLVATDFIQFIFMMINFIESCTQLTEGSWREKKPEESLSEITRFMHESSNFRRQSIFVH